MKKSWHIDERRWFPSPFVLTRASGSRTIWRFIESMVSFDCCFLHLWTNLILNRADFVTVAMVWCVTVKKAKLILEVPRAGSDSLFFNLNRWYGPKRLPFLTTNFSPADVSPKPNHHSLYTVSCQLLHLVCAVSSLFAHWIVYRRTPTILSTRNGICDKPAEFGHHNLVARLPLTGLYFTTIRTRHTNFAFGPLYQCKLHGNFLRNSGLFWLVCRETRIWASIIDTSSIVYWIRICMRVKRSCSERNDPTKILGTNKEWNRAVGYYLAPR